ncbi:MAG: CRTAC1 family protein [Chloroflexota bacterium]
MLSWRFLLLPIYFLLVTLLHSACTAVKQPTFELTQTSFVENGRCSNKFVAHPLPHVTAESVERIGFFISNGSGLAVNDLDQDGDHDIVLGNILGPVQIFWNQGNFEFEAQVLFEGSVRAVTVVDFNGDGLLDLLFSTRNGRIEYFHNQGDRVFVEQRLGTIDAYVYSMDLGDVDLDGDLDLVTASYDASMELIHRNAFGTTGAAGVYWHENVDNNFTSYQLAPRAQALALQLVDLDGNGRLDLHVGNDFDIPDFVWLNSEEGWELAELFDRTTMSTMSFDRGDVNNDGQRELFAADMHPYSEEPEIMAQWQPILDNITHDVAEDDAQRMANVLQSGDPAASFLNVAEESGLSATGWSWSSKFGDIDQDGYLDLYVVNGMQALNNFSHLPNDTLVEENLALQNNQSGQFERVDAWGLNSTLGGRSMSMADLDNDGDLDIVVNNLAGPSQIYENQLCQGDSLQVELEWAATPNRYGIGAQLFLESDSGVLQRDVRVTSGYLSGDPVRVHFGFKENTAVTELKVVWPDGIESVHENVQNGLVRVSRIDQ